ncbi:sulfatase [Dokdonella sp.]|uniref:sulfatase family protein n=1 Tax=Dokdonella sp. TaxID=2291710 RepID=UPI003527318D
MRTGVVSRLSCADVPEALRSLLVSAGLLLSASAVAANQPSIVVLMADDLDVATLDIALELGLMPTLESELAAEGLRFDESFVTDSLCCPSRASFLTGQYPHNHGVRRGQSAPGGDGSFAAFDDNLTVANVLLDAGYRTALVGKFLNGYGYEIPRNHPECNSTECKMRYVPSGWSDWQGLPDYGELNGTPGYAGAYCMYNYTVNDNGNLVTYGTASTDYQTDVIAERAGALIDEVAQDGAPLFLVVSPLVPHYELCVPAFGSFDWDIRPAPRHVGSLPLNVSLDTSKPSLGEADVSDKPYWFADEYPVLHPKQMLTLNRQFRHRLEALRSLDDLFARIRQRLLVAGRWHDTYVFFTSDNGWLYGEHRVPGKVLAYEESIRVPLMLRGPGIAQGERRAAMVLNNDLAPTIAELAGVSLSAGADGRSLVPLFLHDNPPDWRRRFLVEHFRDVAPAPGSYLDYLAVRTAAGDSNNTGNQILIDWRTDWLVDPSPAGIEHYDLASDPYQLDALPADSSLRATQRAVLKAGLALLQNCGEAGRVTCMDAERIPEHLFFAGFD